MGGGGMEVWYEVDIHLCFDGMDSRFQENGFKKIK